MFDGMCFMCYLHVLWLWFMFMVYARVHSVLDVYVLRVYVSGLCFMVCMLSVMFSVLCVELYVLCVMCYVLCVMRYVFVCFMCSGFCFEFIGLRFMLYD